MKSLEKQVGGNHYKKFKIQPIEFILANNLGFVEGNVIKYICRHEFKNGIEDIEKVKHYCDLLIDHLKKQETSVKLNNEPVQPARSLYDGECLPPIPSVDERLNKIREDLKHPKNPSLHV